MARKRGGFAGLWDRNKGWLKYVAPAVVGAIPGLGPMAAMGLGAAMGGLDREGKRGIGVDIGGAARGAVTGYGAGQLGAAGAGKLGIGTKAAGAKAAAVGGKPPSTFGEKAKAAANYAFKENPKVGEFLVEGIQSGIPSAKDETDRMQFELQQRQYNDLLEDRRRRAELLLPLWQQYTMGRPSAYTNLPGMR